MRSSTEFYEIMDMLDKRLNDKGKNWRHVVKALKVLDYSLHEGSELVVTWAKQNIYIIRTLREFTYIDEEGRDVGQNVRAAAKELTSLVQDEERLRAERSDRKTWKSRVTGLDEYAQHAEPSVPPRRHRTRPNTEEEDAEYKLALEASKYQEEEDRKKRESRTTNDTDDDDLAKAIKLSKEEEERRRRELEDSNATSLFDDEPVQTPQPQPQHYTGFNQGYQQGSAVDFFANPIDQSMAQSQPTGYMGNAYTGFQSQPTGFQSQPSGYQNGFSNGFGAQPTGYDAFGQQGLQQQQQLFQAQAAGFNPYAQQQQQQPQPVASPMQDSLLQASQPGSNNPWATGAQPQLSEFRPTPTGSNNPFAQQPLSSRPTAFKVPSMPALSSLPEQKTLTNFGQPSGSFSAPYSSPQQSQPQRELSEHEAKLNALLASGDGLDTFGNTGNLRIPAHHTAPGPFVNSAGGAFHSLGTDTTGQNPFMRQQFTGMPTVSYGAQQMPTGTGNPGANGFGGQGSNNPFAGTRPQQQQSSQGDLIQF
jgi:epsin